jgi:hypothetical protein
MKPSTGKGRGRRSPLPPGHSPWYAGLPPPPPEEAAEIPLLSSFASTEPEFSNQPEHVPEFSYPDPQQALPNDHPHLDPALGPHFVDGGPGPFRNHVVGPGAHMTLGGLQHYPLGYGLTPYGPPPGIPSVGSSSPLHPHYHPPQEDQEERRGDGQMDGEKRQEENDNGWNSNIIYSFSETGDITFPGDHSPESFRAAMDAGLSSAGLTAIWRPSTRGELEVRFPFVLRFVHSC